MTQLLGVAEYKLGELLNNLLPSEKDLERIIDTYHSDEDETTLQGLGNTSESTENSTINSTVNSTLTNTNLQLTALQQKIIELMKKEPGITIEEICVGLGKDRNAINYQLRKMKENKIIERSGSAKKGLWIVNI